MGALAGKPEPTIQPTGASIKASATAATPTNGRHAGKRQAPTLPSFWTRCCAGGGDDGATVGSSNRQSGDRAAKGVQCLDNREAAEVEAAKLRAVGMSRRSGTSTMAPNTTTTGASF